MNFTTELKCHLSGLGNSDADVLHARILNFLDSHFEVHRCNSVSRYAFHTFCFRILGDPAQVVKKVLACRHLVEVDFELNIVKEVEHQLV